jgi:hypothetical protein
MKQEIIIAPDFEAAADYARRKKWDVWETARAFRCGFGGEAVQISYVATPMALEKVPAGTPVHVAGFPAGIPSAWARSLAPHSVVANGGRP